jgi:hypothetical protein
VRFPKTVRFRRVEATIYGRTKRYDFYRLAYYVSGKRVIRSFKNYREAKDEAELKVREIAEGSLAAALNADQSRDALAALERLETFRLSTGKRLSLLGVVSEHVEALEKLNGRSLVEAIEGYLQTVATVTRKDVSEAVAEFVDGRKHTGRLYSTLLRHFQKWTGKTAGVTFSASDVLVAVVRCPASRALDLQNTMIEEFRPKYNVNANPYAE